MSQCSSGKCHLRRQAKPGKIMPQPPKNPNSGKLDSQIFIGKEDPQKATKKKKKKQKAKALSNAVIKEARHSDDIALHMSEWKVARNAERDLMTRNEIDRDYLTGLTIMVGPEGSRMQAAGFDANPQGRREVFHLIRALNQMTDDKQTFSPNAFDALCAELIKRLEHYNQDEVVAFNLKRYVMAKKHKEIK